MPSGDDEVLLTSRADFMNSVVGLAEHLELRVTAIREAMESAAAQDEARSRLFQEIWRPKLVGLAQDIQDFRRRAATNPTLCAMGKRGQGKTSLLRTWLAGDVTGADGNHPLAAILDLPSGPSDTTAALVRVRSVRKDDSRYDPRYLYCLMLENHHVAELKEERPPAPPVTSLQVTRDSKKAYWLCRFPYEKQEAGHTVDLESMTGIGTVSTNPNGVPLANFQWHAREVLIPVELEGVPSESLGVRTLNVLDIIDAPGADAAMQGVHHEWKRYKNSLVFTAAIHELDVLLLIASSDPAAAQLGAQFQEEIWFKWLERCRDDKEVSGRLVLAFTNAAKAFESAEKRITGDSRGNNDVSDFANLICKNVLEQLAPHPPGVPQLLRPKDPRTWPPMFFFEQEDQPMTRFREGIEPGGGPAMAERVLSQLDSTNGDLAEALPLGARCILSMARDLMTSESISVSGRLPVATWVVRALCQLLDPADRGYGALTETIHEYATGGPVARNHATELAHGAESNCDKFRGLLSDLATPAGNQKALRDVELAQSLLGEYWAAHPGGPKLYIGPRCRDRRSQIGENITIIGTTRHPINHDMVLDDVSRDAVDQLRSHKPPWSRDQADIVARVLHACLKGDVALRHIAARSTQAIARDHESLHRTQTVALERVVRVVDFLVNADTAALGLIASHCFQIDLDEAALVGEVPADIVTWSPDDEAQLAAVAEAHEKLLTVIERFPCVKPYAVNDA